MPRNTRISSSRGTSTTRPRRTTTRTTTRSLTVRRSTTDRSVSRHATFQELFVTELRKVLSCENQIIVALPKLIKAATSNDLKQALREHLNETKGQVERLHKIFRFLRETPREEHCLAIAGILRDGEDLVEKFRHSITVDAAIICAAQKVEHYEIAVYGTIRAFAKELNHDEVANLLDESLDEESAADKTLSKLAQGSLFTTGLNKMASEESVALTSGRHR